MNIRERLLAQIEAADSMLDAADDLLHVSSLALRQQDTDADGAVAYVLELAFEKIDYARTEISTMVAILGEEVANGD